MWNASKVRALRARMKMSEAQFAKLLGIEPKMLAAWEDPAQSVPESAAASLDRLQGAFDKAMKKAGATGPGTADFAFLLGTLL
jgi:transcriptional regulator with XRE-family HTH domain